MRPETGAGLAVPRELPEPPGLPEPAEPPKLPEPPALPESPGPPEPPDPPAAAKLCNVELSICNVAFTILRAYATSDRVRRSCRGTATHPARHRAKSAATASGLGLAHSVTAWPRTAPSAHSRSAMAVARASSSP